MYNMVIEQKTKMINISQRTRCLSRKDLRLEKRMRVEHMRNCVNKEGLYRDHITL